MTDYMQVTTTTETKADAQAIASAVVEQRLAGCVQIIGPIASTYWWEGKIETAEEWLCVIKSREDLYEELEKAIQEVHPYEVPEILAIPVTRGSKSYLAWLEDELKHPDFAQIDDDVRSSQEEQ
jgi:periplasmic divalent cation tolerance protein